MLFKPFKIDNFSKSIKYSTPIENIFKDNTLIDDMYKGNTLVNKTFKTNFHKKISTKNNKILKNYLLVLDSKIENTSEEPTIHNKAGEDTLNRRRIMWKQLSKNGILLIKRKKNN